MFTNAPWLVAFHDKELYKANYAGDLERRAGEIREKSEAVGMHEEHVGDER